MSSIALAAPAASVAKIPIGQSRDSEITFENPDLGEIAPVTLPKSLVYVSDQRPGISRRRAGHGWCYRTPDGDIIRDAATIARIRSLAVPPAYREVWICPDPHGHVQVTGLDARGRKQYRYHPAWREFRDASKFDRLPTFIRALPGLRTRLASDLARHGLPREKVLATVIRLMETTFIRVGNEQYAKQNKSFGLTTLRSRHAKIGGNKIELSFRAKSGIKWHVVLRNRQLVSLVRRLLDLPGQELFQFLDSEGHRHSISSGDVNDYLREVTSQEITAKDFRTWAGSWMAALALAQMPVGDSENARKHGLLQAVKEVAAALGNTPAICRKCYISPVILDAYMAGTLSASIARLTRRFTKKPMAGLSIEEASVLTFLEQAQTR